MLLQLLRPHQLAACQECSSKSCKTRQKGLKATRTMSRAHSTEVKYFKHWLLLFICWVVYFPVICLFNRRRFQSFLSDLSEIPAVTLSIPPLIKLFSMLSINQCRLLFWSLLLVFGGLMQKTQMLPATLKEVLARMREQVVKNLLALHLPGRHKTDVQGKVL